MTKRIVSLLIALVLALGCAFAVAETTTEGKTRYISARRGLNIRAAADLEAEIVATPDFNYTVKVVGEEGKWSQVVYESNGQVYEGYCWTAYLSDHKIVVKKAVEKVEEEPEEKPEEEVTGGQSGSTTDDLNKEAQKKAEEEGKISSKD